MKKWFLAGVLCFIATPLLTQSIYYSNCSCDPAVLTNWDDNPTGAGNAPANFSGFQDVFIIQDGHVMQTTGNAWNISAINGELRIDENATLIADDETDLVPSMTFRIRTGGEYIHNNLTKTIFDGTELFEPYSTVIIRQWTGTKFVDNDFGNLTFDINNTPGNNFSTALTAGDTLYIQGDLEIKSTGGKIFSLVNSGTAHNVVMKIKRDLIFPGGYFDFVSSSATGADNREIIVGGDFFYSDSNWTNGGSKTLTIRFPDTSTYDVEQGVWGLGFTNDVNYHITGTGKLTLASFFNLGSNCTLNIDGHLDMDTNIFVLSANRYVFLNNDATLESAHPSGVDGSMNVEFGNYAPEVNYVFSGRTRQETGFSNKNISQAASLIIANDYDTVCQNGTDHDMVLSEDLVIEQGSILEIPDDNNFDLSLDSIGKVAINGTVILADKEGFFGNLAAFKIFQEDDIQADPNARIIYNNDSSQVITGQGFVYPNLEMYGGMDKSPDTTLRVTGELILGGEANLDLSLYSCRLSGNILVGPHAKVSGSQPLEFDGSNPQFITNQNTALTFPEIEIVNSPGIYLNDSIRAGKITFGQGIMHSSDTATMEIPNDGLVSGASAISHISGPVIKTGDDSFVFPVGDGTTLRSVSYSNQSADTSAQLRVAYFAGNPPDYQSLASEIDHISQLEYWDMQGSGLVNADLELNWEGGVDDTSSLIIAGYDGVKWQNLGGEINGSSLNGTISIQNIINIQPLTFGSTDAGNPLPVELVKFEVTEDHDEIRIDWVTAFEMDNDYFTVERSRDGRNFEPLAVIEGARSSTVPVTYEYLDKTPFPGPLYYRLKQTDLNGQFKYSTVRLIYYIDAVEEISVYPVPAGDRLNIQLPEERPEYEISLLTMDGKVVFKTRVEKNGLYTLEVAGLVAGPYMLCIRSDAYLRNVTFLKK